MKLLRDVEALMPTAMPKPQRAANPLNEMRQAVENLDKKLIDIAVPTPEEPEEKNPLEAWRIAMRATSARVSGAINHVRRRARRPQCT